MTKRAKLSSEDVEAFLVAHPGWAREGDAISRTYAFTSYAAGVAFVVRVGFLAEKRDHHPDIALGYARAKVSWTTHDQGGITSLDAELAAATDALHDGPVSA